jgi:hypothetical protein
MHTDRLPRQLEDPHATRDVASQLEGGAKLKLTAMRSPRRLLL